MTGPGDTRVEWRDVCATDGHRWQVLAVEPTGARRRLVWLPALGVPARHYEPFGRALAARGVAVHVHEWRGLGSSSWRASRRTDWGYRALLMDDLPRTLEVAEQAKPGVSAVIGGHSLGGQLASCALALDPSRASALWLVASGAPYFRAFPRPTRFWLPAAYRLLPTLARIAGALPGRRIGFGGQEARSVMSDWAGTALSGRYCAPGVGDLEQRLRDVTVPVRAVLLAHDWLAPRPSLDYLLAKISSPHVDVEILDSDRLGARADHFAWMKAPDAVAGWLADAPAAMPGGGPPP